MELPPELLEDVGNSAELDDAVNVERQGFATRLEVARYLHERLAKLPQASDRDERHTQELSRLWRQLQQRREVDRKAGIADVRLAEFRWMVEEQRVSLFAQELKTPVPVSVKRLTKLWQTVRR